MSPSTREHALCAVVGCCLLATAGGCRFHRTGRGFILRSQWTLECENIPRLSFSTAGPEAPTDEQSSAEPKRLRWRLRRRGYQLASRLFGRGEYAYHGNTHPILSAETREPNDRTGDEDHPPTSEQAVELRPPEASFDSPDSRRPDLAVD
ncbi:MAG: hypothetical protein JW959_03500 [Pirellulales bacterium]|nr:hypothetical protein [Pirellulales bacterium]